MSSNIYIIYMSSSIYIASDIPGTGVRSAGLFVKSVVVGL
jgi:hypothetical protein